MNNQPPVLRQMLGGLGTVATSSLFRNAMKHWWLTAPLGYTAYMMIRERQKKKQLTVSNVISDLTPMLTLVASMVTLNYILTQQDGQPSSASPKPAFGPIKDAAFTPSARPAPLPGLPVPERG